MKLSEKIKAIPKKKLVILCALVLLLITALIMMLVSANRSQDTNDQETEERYPSNVNVFNPSNLGESDKEPSQTLDLTGTDGLAYVSRGDGTCYIAGIGTCEDTELQIPQESPTGDIVIKIHDNAFANCTQLLSVSIPSTVKTVGTGVFRGCSRLVAINVSQENTVYSSVGGVLFSKDKSVLICYPMNRPGTSYLLSTGVKAIAAFAFENVVNLNKLLYEGNIAKYQSIDVLMGNDLLDKITITCNYVAAK